MLETLDTHRTTIITIRAFTLHKFPCSCIIGYCVPNGTLSHTQADKTSANLGGGGGGGERGESERSLPLADSECSVQGGMGDYLIKSTLDL